MPKLRPFYEDVQAHYDLSDDFYRLFLDPSMTYSCAYFERDDMTLAEAQRAKVDLSLSKCNLRPGLRLLDVGCGWGATVRRAAEKYGVHAIGLTLSVNQHAHAKQLAADQPLAEYRLQGWEEFDEPVDRVVSIGAFEHFRVERYEEFFARCRRLLPADGCMMIHSIVHGTDETRLPDEPEWSAELIDYMRFIKYHIFPGGQVPAREAIINSARGQGFELTRLQSLQLHYARTLTCWAQNLAANESQAVALTSREVFDRYMRYLTQSAHYFRTGHIDVCQFSLQKR
ncbi:MAG: class I SAM-dependent methyltransferase [Pirellulales bacterium]|nr:class I SAM-dependent methyltransferase [Pirellulales bacterium]